MMVRHSRLAAGLATDLAAEFPQATREEWRSLALGVLRRSGVLDETSTPAEVEAALSTTTYDGVTVAPLHDRSDLPDVARVLRQAASASGAGGWDVRQRHGHPDPRVTREAIIADLENGVTSIWLDVAALGQAAPGRPPNEASAGKGLDTAMGTALGTALGMAVDTALDGVLLELAPVVLDAGLRAAEAGRAFLDLLDRRGIRPGAEAAGGNLGLDPLGVAARLGLDIDTAIGPDIDLVRRCLAERPSLRAITVDATPYHDAGGGDAEELGCSIATGVAYLRALTGAGFTVEEALGQLEFRYAATADQFLTIAKLRAARRLWARVAEVCAGPDRPEQPTGQRTEDAGLGDHGYQRQHAVTSSAMMTARDPWVNMLRTTLACFAAGVGGADAVTVQPFDACLGLPDGFARRIARNTHALLVEESNIARVIDPAGGSWYVERLTADLAERAWGWFQEIERAGGMAAALADLVPERIAATRTRRMENIARRRDPITGVSEFPNLDETLLAREPGAGLAGAATARPHHADTGRDTGPDTGPATAAVGGLPRIRYAEEFEALRDLADAEAVRPRVFLATIGPLAAHTARASFAANLFAAGGVETVAGGPGTDPPAIARAFRASDTAVACLCSSDRMYGEHAEAVAAALREAGARRIWLAGKGDYEGVDANLHVGCDVLSVLRTTFEDLGVGR